MQQQQPQQQRKEAAAILLTKTLCLHGDKRRNPPNMFCMCGQQAAVAVISPHDD
jgi:hypothetical protein